MNLKKVVIPCFSRSLILKLFLIVLQQRLFACIGENCRGHPYLLGSSYVHSLKLVHQSILTTDRKSVV